MKLQTSIKPRRDGVVLVTGQDAHTYKFEPSESGELECTIEHEPTLKHLLATQNFYPASEEDFTLALALTQDDAADAAPGDQSQEPSLGALAAKSDADLDEDGDEGDINALPVEGPVTGLPVEANTPPQTDPARAARKNAALQKAAKAAAAK